MAAPDMKVFSVSPPWSTRLGNNDPSCIQPLKTDSGFWGAGAEPPSRNNAGYTQ